MPGRDRQVEWEEPSLLHPSPLLLVFFLQLVLGQEKHNSVEAEVPQEHVFGIRLLYEL